LQFCGALDERIVEKLLRDAKQKGLESFQYAFNLDELEEERVRGKTWECGHASFTTETKRWEIIDAPGHRQFIPHMIGGASQADVAVLIISARKGEFETGFERDGQTREHIVLARTVGVTSMVVAVNKMDDPSVQWDEDRYNHIKENLLPFLKTSGWKPDELSWVPISGFTGSNLKELDPAASPWYKSVV
jgi:peptide chain release factor subunit 3